MYHRGAFMHSEERYPDRENVFFKSVRLWPDSLGVRYCQKSYLEVAGQV